MCVGLFGLTKRGKDKGRSGGGAMYILAVLGKVKVTWWDTHDRS